MIYKIRRSKEFVDWLFGLAEKTRLQVTARMSRVELHGHFGDTNALGGGLFELKWKSGLRVYYIQTDKNEITLILGGTKHGQNKDIKKAKKLINR